MAEPRKPWAMPSLPDLRFISSLLPRWASPRCRLLSPRFQWQGTICPQGEEQGENHARRFSNDYLIRLFTLDLKRGTRGERERYKVPLITHLFNAGMRTRGDEVIGDLLTWREERWERRWREVYERERGGWEDIVSNIVERRDGTVDTRGEKEQWRGGEEEWEGRERRRESRGGHAGEVPVGNLALAHHGWLQLGVPLAPHLHVQKGLVLIHCGGTLLSSKHVWLSLLVLCVSAYERGSSQLSLALIWCVLTGDTSSGPIFSWLQVIFSHYLEPECTAREDRNSTSQLSVTVSLLNVSLVISIVDYI